MKNFRISPALQSDWLNFVNSQDFTDVARVITWIEQNIYDEIDIEEFAWPSDFEEDTLVKWFDEEVLGNGRFSELAKSIFFCQREFSKFKSDDDTLEELIEKSVLEDYAERWAYRNGYKKEK